MIIIILKDKSKMKYYNYYLAILSRILPFLCFTFFGQIFGFLISIFKCDGDISIIDKSLKCRTGLLYYIDSVLCIICLCFFICISYMNILVFFKPDFILEESSVLKKSSSCNDVILFVNKIIFNILFDIITNTELFQWFILFVLFVFTFVNVACLFHFNNYKNRILMKLHKILGSILFWAICCLIIGKIFDSLLFNGVIHLISFGTILIIIYYIYHKEKINSFYTMDFKQIYSSKGQLDYIKNIFYLIKNKDKCRKNFMIFNTLILLKEENCINKNCKIKKYLQMAGKGFESDFILFQYCQQLFEMAIKKYPNDIILKCNYIIYLVIQMRKKKLAQKVLSSIREKLFDFENNYIIFCCKNYIGLYNPEIKKNFEQQNKNIMKAMEYEKQFDIFKESLSRAASLYYEFWSSLYKSHLQSTEDFIKLNDIGEKLNSLIDKIDELFKKLHNVKSDDTRVINLYSGFLKHILNNKTKYNDLKNILISLPNACKIQDREIDYCNFDLKMLNISDEFKYIIISAEEENLGIILNISLNTCQVFGYNKNELIGKKITILLPEIYHKQLELSSLQYTNKVKTKFYDLLSHKKEYYPDFLEVFIEGKNKSKYLIPLFLKIFFAQTEENEHVFILEFLYDDEVIINKMNEKFNFNSSNNLMYKELQYYNYCYVLTDCKFNIQLFSANCLELLGLNSDAINANIDITKYIEQFNDEVEKIIFENNNNENTLSKKSDLNLLNFTESFKNKNTLNITYKSNCSPNHISLDKILIYKRIIAENKYSQLKIITWKIYELMQVLLGNKNNNNSNISASYRSAKNQKVNISETFITKKNIFYGNIKERYFYLVIQKATLNGKQVGYKFYFKRKDDHKFNYNKTSIVKQKIMRNKTPHRNKVSFNTLKIENNDSGQNDEGVIRNSNTEYRKLYIKMSKSLKNLKNDKNTQNIEDINNSTKANESNDISNKSLERTCSVIVKQNCLKKNPSKFCSLISNSDRIFSSIHNLKIIEQNYVPNSNFSFLLDIENMSFRPCFKECKTDETTNLLKNEAINKLKQYQVMKNNIKKGQISFSSDDSSLEQTESNEEDSNYSFEDSSSSYNKIRKGRKTLKPNDIKKEKENDVNDEKKNYKAEIEGNYYKVEGLNKIKFMIYDFEQEMIIEQGIKKDHKSEVENIIINYKLKIPNELDKDVNDPSIKMNKILSKYSNSDIKKENSSAKMTNIGLIDQKKSNKEQETNKRIENALIKNNNKEQIITKFLIFVLLSLGVLLLKSGFILYYILSNLDTINRNLLLIIYSSNLRHYTNMGIYFVREMNVLSLGIEDHWDNIYKNYPNTDNRTEYLEKIDASIKESFALGHANMESMMGVNFDLNEKNEYYLNKKPFKTVLIYEQFKNRTVSSNLFVSIVQIYSFLYNIIITQDYTYDKEGVFNFMQNSMNDVGIGIENIINIYLSEIKIRKTKYNIISTLILIVAFIIYLGIYFLITISYIQIIHRKESFISVFYCINLSFIKASMIKCEKFISKINPNELLITQEKINNNAEESISYSHLDEDFILNNREKNNNNNNKFNKKKEKKIKYKEKKKYRIFKIKLFIILLFFFAFTILIVGNYINLMKEVEIMGSYIYHMQHYHNNLINLFNAYREFILVNESTMYNEPIVDYLGKAEKIIYDTFTDDINYIAENSNKISGLNKIFMEIQKNQLCYKNSEGEISSLNSCDYYMEIITSLGFYNFISFWVEEIRIKKNYFLLIEENNINPMLNVSMNSVGQENDFNDSQKKVELKVIYYFNLEEIHPDVNYMFNYVILPYINDERNLTINRIIYNMKNKKALYIAFFIIYFLLISMLYIFFWRPIINNIKTLIYKTKYMLTIIPIETLSTQTNIKNLLGIYDLNE